MNILNMVLLSSYILKNKYKQYDYYALIIKGCYVSIGTLSRTQAVRLSVHPFLDLSCR